MKQRNMGLIALALFVSVMTLAMTTSVESQTTPSTGEWCSQMCLDFGCDQPGRVTCARCEVACAESAATFEEQHEVPGFPVFLIDPACHGDGDCSACPEGWFTVCRTIEDGSTDCGCVEGNPPPDNPCPTPDGCGS